MRSVSIIIYMACVAISLLAGFMFDTWMLSQANTVMNVAGLFLLMFLIIAAALCIKHGYYTIINFFDNTKTKQQ